MQERIDIAAASAAASAATKATYGSSAVAVGSWFLSNEFGVLMGAIGVIGGLLLSWHWHRKTYELQKRAADREHKLRLLEHEARVALHNTRNRKDPA